MNVLFNNAYNTLKEWSAVCPNTYLLAYYQTRICSTIVPSQDTCIQDEIPETIIHLIPTQNTMEILWACRNTLEYLDLISARILSSSSRYLFL